MTASPRVRPEAGTWLAAWLDRLQAANPMLDAVIDEVDGRRIRVGGRWLHDFASCNYLGLDLDREVIEGIPAYLTAGGPIPAGRGCLAARCCTSRSRPPCGSCSGSRTCCCCPP